MCISFKPSSPIDNPLYGQLLFISFFQSPTPYPILPLLTTFIVNEIQDKDTENSSKVSYLFKTTLRVFYKEHFYKQSRLEILF